MRYGLGVDLGTTFTAVALSQEGHVEMVGLGERTVVTPSVVYAREAGPPLIGDAAVRRELGDPARAGREFKRRLGDPSPMLLGDTAFSPAMLMATVLGDVLGKAESLQGGPPEKLVLTHPAVWGPYRREQFAHVPQMCGLEDVTIVTEPVAAATYYTSRKRLDEGDVVAVYDLGGGTFDATVVRMTDGVMEILGEPEGLEWLGGIDFDETIFAFLDRSLGGRASALDPKVPQDAIALFRLRQECVMAKEALSVDDEVVIQAFLPDGPVSARLTRAEFESFIRPAVASTVEAMHRALKSAQVTPGELASVLLVGGSSRIPLVAQLLEQELRRPTVVDAHPKHAVALGAAIIADQVMRTGTRQATGTTVHTELRSADDGLVAAHAPARTLTRTPPVERPVAEPVPEPVLEPAAASPAPAPAAPSTPLPSATSPSTPTAPVRAPRAPRPPRLPSLPPWPKFSWPDWWPGSSMTRTGPIVVAVLVVMAVIGVITALLNRPEDRMVPQAQVTAAPTAAPTTSATGTASAGSVTAPVVRGVVRSLGDRPQGAAVSPDGKRAYVASVVGNTVSVIDTASDSVLASIAMPVPPQYVVMDPVRPRAYVTLIDPQGAKSALAVIDTSKNQLLDQIPVGGSPLPPAVTPDGATAWVPDRTTSQIWVVDLNSSKVTRKIDVAGLPSAVAFGPGGSRAYVTNFDTEQLSVFEPDTGQLVGKLRVGVTPIAVTVSPDGRLVAVANYDSKSVSLVDAESSRVTSTITVGANPQSVAFAGGGASLLVANTGDGTVSTIDVAAARVVSSTKVGREPWWVAAAPAGDLVYAISAGDDSATALTLR